MLISTEGPGAAAGRATAGSSRESSAEGSSELGESPRRRREEVSFCAWGHCKNPLGEADGLCIQATANQTNIIPVRSLRKDLRAGGEESSKAKNRRNAENHGVMSLSW